jgi:transcriptional regulator with XRE-family HTH domain
MIDATALRRLRHDRGISQRKLATAAGVDPLTIQRLETGADCGDLPLRALRRVADTLGVTPAHLLGGTPETLTEQANPDVTARVGATLLAFGNTSITVLATGLGVRRAQVRQSVDQLAAELPVLGIAVARHGDHVWLAPSRQPAAAASAHKPLRLDQARLLRRIQRGEDIRAKLGKTDRELVLPDLLRRNLVSDAAGVLRLAGDATLSLALPEPGEAAVSAQQDEQAINQERRSDATGIRPARRTGSGG